jgi:hypothetical protein
MRPFSLESRMLTLRGVFYPTGYVFVMLPTLADATKLEHDLRDGGYDDHEILLIEPQAILEQIGKTVRVTDSPLPSLGTEAATVLEYRELAHQGHCAVMVHAPSETDTQRVMDVVHTLPFSYAQKYRRLVIEDLH